MGTRLRILMILLGALLVAATYTFPIWWPQVRPQQGDLGFPGLADDLQVAFLELPALQRGLYLQLNATNNERALAVLTAALSPVTPLPPEEQQPPQIDSSVVTVASGDFAALDTAELVEDGFIEAADVSPWLPLFSADGSFTIYEYPDERKLLWLEGFGVTNGPNLRIGLATVQYPASYDQIEQNVLDLGPLRGAIGNQQYAIPIEEDLGLYRAVVVYDPIHRLIYGVALF
ncbi:hypothetical protein HC928_24955 [bacterium]|nr:hypothetical protein [bacterium]